MPFRRRAKQDRSHGRNSGMITETRPDLGSRLLGSAVCPAPLGTARTRRRTGLGSDAALRNDLLMALPEETLARVRPLLERVDLKRRQVLHERNVASSHA